MNRRVFLAAGVAAAAAGHFQIPNTGRNGGRGLAATPRLRAKLGQPIRVPQSSGDLWTATWANDDNLYVASDDTSAFRRECNSNLAVSRLTGYPPEVRGTTVNCMKPFGEGSEMRREDGGMWKACGLISIDGVLYMSVSRQSVSPTEPDGAWEGRWSPFFIQECWDASIIKSSDHGKTWSPIPQLGRAMFPGRSFSTPFFVQYGKDGQSSADGGEGYVYAVSNDGAWNNGNWMTLGRVRRDRIALLRAADWEFVHGFDDRGGPVWSPRYDDALYTFRAPGRTSMTGIHYIAPLRLYIMPQWHYPLLETQQGQLVRGGPPSPQQTGTSGQPQFSEAEKIPWEHTRLELYYAPKPWGPWMLFHVQDLQPQSWYNPCIPSKFISADGRKFWLFVAGDFLGNRGYYSLNMIPVTLDVTE